MHEICQDSGAAAQSCAPVRWQSVLGSRNCSVAIQAHLHDVLLAMQYSRGGDAVAGPSGRARHEGVVPGSITIGGSGNVRSRFGQRGHEVGCPHLPVTIPACSAPIAYGT